jgi:hypothetical protein
VKHENKIVKDVIVYEIGLDTESQELPQPKLEEPVIQELSYPYAEQEHERNERNERNGIINKNSKKI